VAAPQPAVTLEPLTDAERDEAWAAYFQANYGYDEALELARIWQLEAKPGEVKAEAGRRLLAGETLPVAALPKTPEQIESDKDMPKLNAFFDAGYEWDDAVELARLWRIADPSDAKVAAGEKLLAGETLPVAP